MFDHGVNNSHGLLQFRFELLSLCGSNQIQVGFFFKCDLGLDGQIELHATLTSLYSGRRHSGSPTQTHMLTFPSFLPGASILLICRITL